YTCAYTLHETENEDHGMHQISSTISNVIKAATSFPDTLIVK
ncbi:17565_t:CDS:1, partial [Funneliformis geosporum]